MTNADKIAFAETLYALGEVFNETVSEIRVSLYFEALRDFDIRDIRTGAMHLLRDAEYFPRPKHLRTAAKQASRTRLERKAEHQRRLDESQMQNQVGTEGMADQARKAIANITKALTRKGAR